MPVLRSMHPIRIPPRLERAVQTALAMESALPMDPVSAIP